MSASVAISEHCWLQFVQFPVKVEHFDATMVCVSAPLIAVMGIETALMAVMRLDVVSYQNYSGWAWELILWLQEIL